MKLHKSTELLQKFIKGLAEGEKFMAKHALDLLAKEVASNPNAFWELLDDHEQLKTTENVCDMRNYRKVA